MRTVQLQRSASRLTPSALGVVAGVVLSAMGGASGGREAGFAQPGLVAAGGASREAVGLSRGEALRGLESTVEIEFAGQPLHDVVRYLSLVAGVEIDVFWGDDRGEQGAPGADKPARGGRECPGGPGTIVGLDPMVAIRLEARGLSVLGALEAVLRQVGGAQGLEMGATWQFSAGGGVEVGPREWLNREAARRVEVYDIADLLVLIPRHGPGPELRLDDGGRGRQAGSAHRGGRSVCRPTEGDEAGRGASADVVELVTSLVEPGQWVGKGGDAAEMCVEDGALIVMAPDYVHRGVQRMLGDAVGGDIQTKYE